MARACFTVTWPHLRVYYLWADFHCSLDPVPTHLLGHSSVLCSVQRSCLIWVSLLLLLPCSFVLTCPSKQLLPRSPVTPMLPDPLVSSQFRLLWLISSVWQLVNPFSLNLFLFFQDITLFCLFQDITLMVLLGSPSQIPSWILVSLPLDYWHDPMDTWRPTSDRLDGLTQSPGFQHHRMFTCLKLPNVTLQSGLLL